MIIIEKSITVLVLKIKIIITIMIIIVIIIRTIINVHDIIVGPSASARRSAAAGSRSPGAKWLHHIILYYITLYYSIVKYSMV